MRARRSIMPFLAAIAVLPATAVAQNWRSADTALDLERCEIVEQRSLSTDFSCAGWEDFPVLVRYGEHRVFVSYGADAANEIVWTQSLPSRNKAGETLEWLLTGMPGEGQRPIGTILRYFIDRSEIGTPDEQVLVITKLAPGNTCHVAYIDARRNAQANELARRVAQELISDWDCETMLAQSFGVMGVAGLPKAR